MELKVLLAQIPRYILKPNPFNGIERLHSPKREPPDYEGYRIHSMELKVGFTLGRPRWAWAWLNPFNGIESEERAARLDPIAG